ncbi:MAG: polyhydroxyalkanoate synthesis repressor PhaR [Magnetococcales bacterium]|nr:polyhydroxyalkanoate synthesis repressor PhaR [Magnetococcales bacterium]
MNDTVRIIRKYSNRRLYDTEKSTYVTLEGIRKLVLKEVPFKVVDKRTNEDITRNILLQIISEQEEMGSPIFTTDVLNRIIRFYGNSLQSQGVLGEYIKQSLDMFVDQQTRLQKSADPINVMKTITDQNLKFWNDMFSVGVKNKSD